MTTLETPERQAPSREIAPSAPEVRIAVAARYSVLGDLRFLAHHDELRMLSRALVRARWPLWFSRGFNPKPRLSLPVPRSVGMESTCQFAVLALREDAPCAELSERLAAVLPTGAPLHEVLNPAPAWLRTPRAAAYEVTLPPQAVDGLDGAIAELLARPELHVERTFGPKKPPRRIEIRRFVEELTLADGVLRMVLRYSQDSTARPAEILTALALGPLEHLVVRRVALAWNEHPAGAHAPRNSHEGNSLG
ncbi:MAG: TIGR03936 family radical SAM-associated protein [Phycisphaerae bacterium]